MLISVIIPCFNEAQNIPTILERFQKLQINKGKMELIIVNNGSSDNSKEILESSQTNYPFLKIVEVRQNQGYGYGILNGLKNSTGEYLCWMHADMQTSPEEIDVFFESLQEKGFPKNIFIKGLRKHRPISDSLFTFGMSRFETIYLGQKLYDINAQPTMFHKSLFTLWETPPFDFSIDLYAYYIAVKNNYLIERIPVIQHEREHGVSSWNTGLSSRLKLVCRVLSYSKTLKKNLK